MRIVTPLNHMSRIRSDKPDGDQDRDACDVASAVEDDDSGDDEPTAPAIRSFRGSPSLQVRARSRSVGLGFRPVIAEYIFKSALVISSRCPRTRPKLRPDGSVSESSREGFSAAVGVSVVELISHPLLRPISDPQPTGHGRSTDNIRRVRSPTRLSANRPQNLQPNAGAVPSLDAVVTLLSYLKKSGRGNIAQPFSESGLTTASLWQAAGRPRSPGRAVKRGLA
jgi:hypothetical protein